MDDKITINELKDKVRLFCEERDWDQYHNPKELSIGLITEAAELLDHFRFKSTEQMNSLLKNESKKQEINDELADCLFFILRFAQMNNVDLVSALEKKLKKNNEKYPVNIVKGLNKKYNEY
jgi:NTP pyrophosphatase (non-canonical NTP hydrolase)